MIRGVKRGLQSAGRVFGHVLRPVGRSLIRFFVLPLYRIGVMLRLRIARLALPARGAFVFFITNRYLFHAVIVGVTVVTVLTNIQSRQAHAQDVGQHSLLYALATDQKTEIVEETVQPETRAKDSHYLGSATIINIPHVDFDYDENADQTSPSIIVPGTIAAQPIEEGGAPLAPRTKTENYIVKDSDTISEIAHRFGVTVGTILLNNALTEREYIRPGDSLRIPPVSGILATVKKGDTLQKLANTYSADADEIASFNGITDGQLAVGTEIMIPGGQPGKIVETQVTIIARQTQKPPTRLTTPAQPTEQPDYTDVITEPTPTVKPPDAPVSSAPGAKLLWPTSGHVITQYYGWKHTGVDIDGDYSSPIYAAADGVVEKAGWNTSGYGLMILIDHPNGYMTRYGHTSKMFVKVGDQVKKGQVIAMVGTTGRSTGTHLHFEVYTNNVRVNPLGYIR